MTVRYALLVAPSSNRVYAGEAPRLTEAELAVFGEMALGARLRDLGRVELGGVPYLGFTTDAPLDGRDLAYLSQVSSAYALFEVAGEAAVGGRGRPERTAGEAAVGGRGWPERTVGEAAVGGRGRPERTAGDWLCPVRLPRLARYDDDLVTIPKYPGKTNEQFTQLLLNVTVLASGRAAQMLDRRLVVLDPLCGRGTTLNQALRYGYDVIGIEVDGGHVDAYSAFLRTWLRRKRLKHTVTLHPVRHEHKRVARRLSATLAPTTDAYRAGDTQRVTVLHADTVQARSLLRPGCCDVIVTDAPYGVAHRSRTAQAPARSRSPRDLLADAVPVWAELLRRGGALGLSFNTHLAGRDEIAALLADAGLAVVTTTAYTGFSHWVDQGITRDLLVARKPRRTSRS